MDDRNSFGNSTDSAEPDLQQRIRALEGKFHSPFDFGGISTKPAYVKRRFKRRLSLLRLPDVRGKTVLDIGAWDGYFSFEFERRGAQRVLAIDVWDEGAKQAFLLARAQLGSKVEYRYLDVHDLSPDLVGRFDVVFCAGVLYHLRHPLQCLERIRAVTAGQLILETASLIPAVHERVPQITFSPGDRDSGRYSWTEGGFPTKQWVLHAPFGSDLYTVFPLFKESVGTVHEPTGPRSSHRPRLFVNCHARRSHVQASNQRVTGEPDRMGC